MNLVIVGFGNVGRHYFNLIKKNKKIKRIFILENDKNLRKNNNLNFISLNELEKNKIKLNYAIICTLRQSFKYAKYFLKKIPTLIEKPFVISLSHANKLINLKIKNKTKCWVAFQNRYNKSISQGKKF